jgi:hypothetical protein
MIIWNEDKRSGQIRERNILPLATNCFVTRFDLNYPFIMVSIGTTAWQTRQQLVIVSTNQLVEPG